MLVGFKFYGQSPENGAKSLVYASCAPEDDLRGISAQNVQHIITAKIHA